MKLKSTRAQNMSEVKKKLVIVKLMMFSKFRVYTEV